MEKNNNHNNNDYQELILELKNPSMNKIKSKSKYTILFVCVENAGRSHMAEAFFRKYAPNGYDVTSAGTKYTPEINPVVVKSTSQIGIDISNQKPKEMTESMIKNSTKIINMECMDKSFCPTLFINKVEEWGIEDPKEKPIEKVEEIRNQIENKIRELIVELTQENKEG